MDADEIAALRAELESARRRIADLKARAEEGSGPAWLVAVLDRSDIGVWDWDIVRDVVTWTEALYRTYGYTRESFAGNLQSFIAAMLEEDRESTERAIHHTFTTGEPYHAEYRIRRSAGEIRWVLARGDVTFDDRGKPIRLSGTAIDVTDRKREEAERMRGEIQQRIIDAQRETLRALSAPVIPLAQKTLASPLIGVLDGERIAQLTEVLLGAVRDASAEVVLLDITGVPHIDAGAAKGLLGTAQAVRLLGAELVLTGVRPQVARVLVELSIDLESFVIKANLQSGIEYAMSLRRSDPR